jgi:hypothetical protein
LRIDPKVIKKKCRLAADAGLLNHLIVHLVEVPTQCFEHMIYGMATGEVLKRDARRGSGVFGCSGAAGRLLEFCKNFVEPPLESSFVLAKAQ